MDIVLESVKIIDPKSSFNDQVVNIQIKEGFVEQISVDKIQSEGQTYDCTGKIISPGWVDLSADFCEPGYEYREDIDSGLKSAQQGGFTLVGLLPNTNPSVNNPGQADFIRNRGKNYVTDLMPYSLVTQSVDSNDLVDVFDIYESGTRILSNGYHRLDSSTLIKALLYISSTELKIIQKSISDSGLRGSMHEGYSSTALGLKSSPSLLEYSNIENDILALEYSGGHLHISQISCKESVYKIREAKGRGLSVSCDVSIAHLLYTDENLKDFDTSFKVSPPLRTEEDRKALIKGIMDDTIDAIVSAHRPQDIESKLTDFQQADFGMSTLPVFPAMLLSLVNEVPIAKLVEKLTYGPRRILGLQEVKLEKGYKAVFTIIDPDGEWNYDSESNPSKSANSPLFGKKVKGKSASVINGQSHHMAS